MIRRRGFLLPFVLLLLCVLLLLAMTRHFFSRQQFHMVAHLADFERAYQLACGGLEVGKTRFESLVEFLNDGSPSTFPKREKSPPALKPIFEALFDAQGLPLPAGGRVQIQSDLLGNLLGQVKEARSLEIFLEFKPVGPLFSSPPKTGIQPDLREMGFNIFLHANAQVGEASTRVSSWREARLVNILPPVLGKFALFLRRQGNLDFNRVKDSVNNGLSDSPLIIHSGPPIPFRSTALPKISSDLDQRGWIFLGGALPWRLNLACGGGQPGLAEGLLNPSLIEYPLPTTEQLSTRGDLSAFMAQHGFAHDWRTPAENEPLLLKSEEESECSALLHLSGSSLAPSPTLVIGNVRRRWALHRGFYLASQEKTIPLPWLDESTFGTDRWPGRDASPQAVKLVRDNFNGSFAAYAARMSDVIEEDFNAGNLFAAHLASPDQEKSLLLDPSALPGGAIPVPLSRISINDQPVDGLRIAAGTALSLRDDKGATLFSEADLAELADLSFLTAKACNRFSNAAEFLNTVRRDKAGRILLDGGVLINGNLSLQKPIEIGPGGGGLLLVNGRVEVKSRVTSPDCEPLTIIALQGDLLIGTAEPIQAGLVALNGKIMIPGPARIHGFLAGQEIGFGPPQPGLERRLNYLPSFDPTDTTNRQRMYRFGVQNRERVFVH